MWSSADRLGFGERGLLPSGVPQVSFGPRQGVHAVAVNLWSFRSWAFGGVVLALLALWGALVAPTPFGVAAARRRRRARAAELLLLLGHREHLAALERDRPLRPLLLRAVAGAARHLRGGGRGACVVVASMGARGTGCGGARHERDRYDRRDRGRARRTRRTGAAVRDARGRHRDVRSGARVPPRRVHRDVGARPLLGRPATRARTRCTRSARGTATSSWSRASPSTRRTGWSRAGTTHRRRSDHTGSPRTRRRRRRSSPARARRRSASASRRDPPRASRCTRSSNRTRPATGTLEVAAGTFRASAPLRPSDARPTGRGHRAGDPAGLSLEGDVGDVTTEHRAGRATAHRHADAPTRRGEAAASLVVGAGPDRGRRRDRAAPGADLHQC